MNSPFQNRRLPRSLPLMATVILALMTAYAGCVSDRPGIPERDRITYPEFQASQRSFQLAERHPLEASDNLNLRYTELGIPEGQSVVFVHGVPSSSWMFRFVLDALSTSGATTDLHLIAPDNLGYGASDKPQLGGDAAAEFYSPEAQARRLEELLDGLGVNSAVFVVHDVGGPIVWELIDRRPDLADGLVVLNTIGAPGGFTPPAAMDNPIVQAGMQLMGMEGRALIESTICNMVVDREELDTDVQLQGYTEPFTEGAGAAYLSFLTHLDIVRDQLPRYQRILQELSLPAAVAWGAQDENLQVDPSLQWFAETLSVSEDRSVLLADAKHLITEEEPDLVAEMIAGVAAQL